MIEKMDILFIDRVDDFGLKVFERFDIGHHRVGQFGVVEILDLGVLYDIGLFEYPKAIFEVGFFGVVDFIEMQIIIELINLDIFCQLFNREELSKIDIAVVVFQKNILFIRIEALVF